MTEFSQKISVYFIQIFLIKSFILFFWSNIFANFLCITHVSIIFLLASIQVSLVIFFILSKSRNFLFKLYQIYLYDQSF